MSTKIRPNSDSSAVECRNCSAPHRGNVFFGQFNCAYCGTTNIIKKEEPAVSTNAAGESRDESSSTPKYSATIIKWSFAALFICLAIVAWMMISFVTTIEEHYPDKREATANTYPHTTPQNNAYPTIPPRNQQTVAVGQNVNLNQVRIEVRGVPENAKIFYNGNLVTNNPFVVPREEKIVGFKVEAPGYEPYAISLVPAESQVVNIAMKSKQ